MATMLGQLHHVDETQLNKTMIHLDAIVTIKQYKWCAWRTRVLIYCLAQ